MLLGMFLESCISVFEGGTCNTQEGSRDEMGIRGGLQFVHSVKERDKFRLASPVK